MKKVFTLLALSLLTMSAWAANTYVKVTSLDQLEVGTKYILVNEEASVAMGAITGTSNTYGSAINITITDGVIDLDGTNAVELVLGQGSMDALGHSTWTFDIGGGSHYICWTSGNTLQTVNTGAPNNAMWIANLTDDGVVLTNKVDNSRKLQYNAGAPRFACYASSQKPAVLYVQGEPEDEGIANLNEANALEDDANFNFAGNAVVTVCKNGYVFLRDESGFSMISGVVGDTFENGQVLNPGWSAVKTSNDGWVWFTDAADLSASGETNVDLAAAIVPNSVDESLLNAFVCIKNQTPSFFPARSFTLPDGTKIPKTESLWAGNADATTGNYNVYGVIVKIGGKLMFNIIDYEDYVEEVLKGDVNNDHMVNITDAIELISYILNDEGDINLEAANVNGDDEVNVSDAIAIINFVLNDTW